MVKPETIKKKVKRIDNALDKMHWGDYVDVSLHWITTQIDWLYKFRHIDYAEMSRLTEKAIRVMKML